MSPAYFAVGLLLIVLIAMAGGSDNYPPAVGG